jgi:hypothetical protein
MLYPAGEKSTRGIQDGGVGESSDAGKAIMIIDVKNMHY